MLMSDVLHDSYKYLFLQIQVHLLITSLEDILVFSLIQNIVMIAKDKLSSSLSSSSGLWTTKQHYLYMVTKLT